MSNPYLGEIRMFAGNFAPVDWLLCQGQLLDIATYDALFTLIGTTYGGDGSNTFALPDLRSRVPVHASSTEPLGTTGGVESVTLTTSHLPNHTHPLNGAAGGGTDLSPSGNTWATWSDQQYSSAAANTTMSAAALDPVGGSQPHDNLPPFLAVNFIIATAGIYPSAT